MPTKSPVMRMEIKGDLLRWARERSGLEAETIFQRFPQLSSWEKEESRPTLKQLERLSKMMHAPVGYLFLDKPPQESLPIPDLRTVGNKRIGHPSPDLLETIYICQQRQEWYRDFAKGSGSRPLDFVGSLRIGDEIEKAANAIRKALSFDLGERERSPTWTDALRQFIDQADQLGMLVMSSGVVLNNNTRPLDPDEFRGFAMSDEFAPLIFINGKDSKAAQMFTLAHELAHVWLGRSALSDAQVISEPSDRVERWSNEVAAELLVPMKALKSETRMIGDLARETSRLARKFKVSSLVILRRIYDSGAISKDEFRSQYEIELRSINASIRSSGGDFYLTQAARASKRFTRALVSSTLEGNTLHRDAFRLLGFSKLSTFKELGRSLGVV